MNRQELQRLSKVRRREAKVLLDHAGFAGSYYLMGYSIECAIKAVIAKKTRRYDFPNKQFTLECYMHDLKKLLQAAGVWQELERDMRTNSNLSDNWAVVKDWSETSRYDCTVSEGQARDLYSACTARSNGILQWLKHYW